MQCQGFCLQLLTWQLLKHRKSVKKQTKQGTVSQSDISMALSDRGEKGEERHGVDYTVSLLHNHSTVLKDSGKARNDKREGRK